MRVGMRNAVTSMQGDEMEGSDHPFDDRGEKTKEMKGGRSSYADENRRKGEERRKGLERESEKKQTKKTLDDVEAI